MKGKKRKCRANQRSIQSRYDGPACRYCVKTGGFINLHRIALNTKGPCNQTEAHEKKISRIELLVTPFHLHVTCDFETVT